MCERTYQTSILSFRSRLYRFISQTLVKFAYKRANLVLANSYSMKADLLENFKVKTPVQVIHNPINLSYINEKAAEALPFKMDKSQFYFIAVGGFRKEKNYFLLIEAFFLLKHLPVHLLIVGAGPAEESLKHKVHALALTHHITFCGFDSNPYKYIKKSDCFVLSSYVEGFPNVLLEALACEKPIISTDCKSGPREILSPGTDIHHEATTNYEIVEHGILAPTNDVAILASAMIKMFEDVELREQFSAAALKRARDFDVDEIKKYFHVAFSE